MLKYLACALSLMTLLAIAPAQGQTPPTPPARGQTSVAQAPATAPAPAPALTGAELDKSAAALKQVEISLERRDLTDADLQALRQQIGPIGDALNSAIERLAPRLAEIKARLDQLGPAPDDKAPPENPTVTEERAAQQKSYSDADELSKRAGLLAVRADQIAANIAARRRALFTSSLFQQATSIANAALWFEVWREAPENASVIRGMFGGWIDAINAKFDGWRLEAFWAGLALSVLVYVPLARLARRVLERNPATEKPSRFLKILGAWWVALVIAVPPIGMILIFRLGFDAFDLTSDRLQSFFQAAGAGVVRIAVAAGLARGLFAPTRPKWRLPRLANSASSRLVQVAIIVASIVSVTRLCEALNEIIDASLPFSVATRGLGAIMAAIALGGGLWGLGDDSKDDCLGPQIAKQWNWFGLLRIGAWIAALAVIGAVLIGYPTFASFLLDQALWVSAVVCVFYMATVLVDEAIGASFKSTTGLGRWLIASIGLQRNSLDLLGALLSGAMRLALFGSAAFLVLAPWGVQSTDVPFDFRAAFFGFKIGDVTISPSAIIIAAFIFGIAYAATRAVQQWLDSSLLPHTGLDSGLRNSIKTSLGYVGFLIAAGLALSYLGLSFEKLAIVAGALSVGIGFGLQSIVNNFVSGLILLWERAVRVGDWIVVGGDQGFVRRIDVRSTEIETFDRAQVIIPNSSLVTGVVKNLVRNDRTGRLVVPLTVSGSADPEKVREVLIGIAKAHELVLKIPAPQILFTGMSGAALTFELAAFVGDVETMFRVRSDLHFEIFRKFKAEGFFDTPAPDPTKIQIAGIEHLGEFQSNLRELTREEPARGAAHG